MSQSKEDTEIAICSTVVELASYRSHNCWEQVNFSVWIAISATKGNSNSYSDWVIVTAVMSNDVIVIDLRGSDTQ